MKKRLIRAEKFNRLKDMKLFRDFSYANGAWIAARDGESIDVMDPTDGNRIGTVPSLSSFENVAAVETAQTAFESWSRLLPQERPTLIRKLFDLIIDHREDLAVVMTLEQVKPISEARGEIEFAASFVEFFYEEAKRPNVESVTSHLPTAEIEIRREPVGVAYPHTQDPHAYTVLVVSSNMAWSRSTEQRLPERQFLLVA